MTQNYLSLLLVPSRYLVFYFNNEKQVFPIPILRNPLFMQDHLLSFNFFYLWVAAKDAIQR